MSLSTDRFISLDIANCCERIQHWNTILQLWKAKSYPQDMINQAKERLSWWHKTLGWYISISMK